jgi:hypothetical protein
MNPEFARRGASSPSSVVKHAAPRASADPSASFWSGPSLARYLFRDSQVRLLRGAILITVPAALAVASCDPRFLQHQQASRLNDTLRLKEIWGLIYRRTKNPRACSCCSDARSSKAQYATSVSRSTTPLRWPSRRKCRSVYRWAADQSVAHRPEEVPVYLDRSDFR